jgi:hypothetical protein
MRIAAVAQPQSVIMPVETLFPRSWWAAHAVSACLGICVLLASGSRCKRDATGSKEHALSDDARTTGHEGLSTTDCRGMPMGTTSQGTTQGIHLEKRGMLELHKINLLKGVKICKLDFCKFCVMGKQNLVQFNTATHKTEGI